MSNNSNTLAEQWHQEGEQRGIIIGEQKGIVIGEQRGERKGEIKTIRQLLLITLQNKFDLLPQYLIDDVKTIESPETLNELFRRTLQCESLEQFKGWINNALERSASVHSV